LISWQSRQASLQRTTDATAVCHDELRLPAQVLHPTGGEIVQDAHLMPSVEQALDKMGADETSSTGY
jgi:hypothetical protein